MKGPRCNGGRGWTAGVGPPHSGKRTPKQKCEHKMTGLSIGNRWTPATDFKLTSLLGECGVTEPERLTETIYRIDERTRHIETSMKKMVTQDEFLPVKMIVYGMVGFILLAILGAIVSFVIVNNGAPTLP